MEMWLSFGSEEGCLVQSESPYLVSSLNGFSVSSLYPPGTPLSTPYRKTSLCIEGAVSGTLKISIKLMSLKSYLKSLFAFYPVGGLC